MLRVAILLAFSTLVARAFQLTIFPDPRLEGLADRQYASAMHLAPKRGAILDATGDVLAQSVEVRSVYVNPRQFQAEVEPSDRDGKARSLAKALGVSASKLRETLGRDRAFVWVKRQLPPEKAREATDLDIPGVYAVRENKRFYPNVELAAHLLGFAGIDMNGLEGLENEYDEVLRAEGKRFVRPRDARGRTYTEGLFVESDTAGHDIQLTIDTKIQYLTEVALRRGVVGSKAAAGFAIVQEPSTGRILAMAVQPDFNPNAFGRHKPSEWRNRAIADALEPGSTMKVAVMASALDSGAVKPDQIFFCENGSFEVADRVITDGKEHGWLPPARILQVSSNIGMIKVARELGATRLSERLRKFGFGEPTGVDLPGESAGIVAPGRSWGSVKLATVAFGQGISVTGLQLTNAVSAIANGGVLMRPYVVEKVIGPDGTVVVDRQPTPVRRVIKPETAALVTHMMELVTQDGGTGPAAALERWSVAGKTGTAQKPDLVAGGYSEKRVASFVGFAPASDPQVTILVVIDEPKTSVYGGVVAAPVFREIADGVLRYLQVEPDQESHNVHVSRSAEREGFVRTRSRALARVSARAAAERAEETEPGTVPDFEGLTIRAALRAAEHNQVLLEVDGHGVAVRQDPAPGRKIEPGDTVRIWFEQHARTGA